MEVPGAGGAEVLLTERLESFDGKGETVRAVDEPAGRGLVAGVLRLVDR